MKDDCYIEFGGAQIQVGDVFFVNLKDLLGVKIKSKIIEKNKEYNYSEHASFPHSISTFENFESDEEFGTYDEEIRMNTITLVRYIGNGKFLEYFTGLLIGYQDNQNWRIIHKNIGDTDISTYTDIVTYNHYQNWDNFIDAYNQYQQISLLIKDNKFMYVNDARCFQFQNQLDIKWDNKKQIRTSKMEDIKHTIELMNSISITNMQEAMNKIIAHDEPFAYAEEMIRTFRKRTLD